jgi:pyruvate formate lyase activating enzyme
MISSAGLDPIEKKPLYHFHPGTMIYSIGGWGCNLACEFCQNWSISQQADEQHSPHSANSIVKEAAGLGSIGVAYTYNEPFVGFEFVKECARLARAAGLANVLVTNGYVNSEPAGDLLPLVDALNIDIKSMDASFYKETCHGSVPPVLLFAKQAAAAGCHVEITNLVIPGLNDEDRNFESLASWIRENLGKRTPLHLSAYRPMYRLQVPATSAALLNKGYSICRSALDYVYMGNVVTDAGQDTCCPTCGTTLIRRRGYKTETVGLTGNHCSRCGRVDDIVCPAR